MRRLEESRILVVEDDPLLVSTFVRMFASSGMDFRVSSVSRLDEALTHLAERGADLVLLDLSLPDSQDLDGLKRIQAAAPWAAVVVNTGRADQELALKALRMGAQDYLVKGDIDLEALLRAVRYALERKQVNDRLHATQAQAETIIRSARGLILVLDELGRVERLNQMASEILGLAEEDLLGQPWIERIVAPGDRDAALKAQLNVLATGAPCSFETRILTAGNEERIIAWEQSQRMDRGRSMGMVVFGLELTERIRAQERIRLSEELLIATLDALEARIAILDTHGRILRINHAWRQQRTGNNPLITALIPIHDYRAHCAKIELQETPFALPARAILAVLRGSAKAMEADYPVHEGGEIRWIHLRVSRFENRGTTRTLVTHTDITSNRNMEEALRVSEQLFKLITDNVVDLIAIVTRDGSRLYTSPSYQTVLGYSAEELKGMTPLELLHPDDKPRVIEAGQRLFQDGSSKFIEYGLRHKDGSWRYFESHGILIREGGERGHRALTVARDITERRKAQQDQALLQIQLNHAQKLESIGQLAAGIAHEINTPIQYIGDNAKFLQEAFQDLSRVLLSLQSLTADSLEGDRLFEARESALKIQDDVDLGYLLEDIPRALGQSLEGVERVAKIVNAMKEFSHPGTEEKSRVDLNRAIESTLTVSRNEWKYVADLELDLAPDLPLVPCLPGEFNQVILNLVVNAAHAIAEGVGSTGTKGRIQVVTRQEGPFVVIRIRDSGPGIPKEVRNRIFDPFFTTKPVGKGTGQGLAIARSVIVDRHQGTLHFETEMGVGTEFLIQLPLDIEGEG